MNTKLKMPILLFAILFASQSVYAESAVGYLDILPDLPGFESDMDFILNEKIPVFDDNEKEVTNGYLKLEGRIPWISIDDGEYKGEPLDTRGDEYWGLYSASSIKYYEWRGDLVRVLANRINGGVWIQLNHQFEKDGKSVVVKLVPNEWKSSSMGTPSTWGQRGQEPWRTSGYDGFHLRTEPSFKSKVVIRLDRRWHIIKYGTGRTEGKWAEVLVEEILGGLEGCYSFEELKPYLTGKVATGWLKILSESSEPNIETGGTC